MNNFFLDAWTLLSNEAIGHGRVIS